MSIFDDLITIDTENNIVSNEWIEWQHFLMPNKPEWLRAIVRNLWCLFGHCLNCSAIDGCYFVKRNMPKLPLHERCDCYNVKKDFSKIKKIAKAECDIRKFTEYVFKNTIDSKGKNQIFYNLGYNVDDSNYLKEEFCKQALKQYLEGNYVLKNLDMRGQRLAIITNLKGTKFYSGWMLCPNGKIKNVTPFGGWIK